MPTTDADKLFTVFYITIGLSVIYAVSYMVVVLSVSNAACSLLAHNLTFHNSAGLWDKFIANRMFHVHGTCLLTAGA